MDSNLQTLCFCFRSKQRCEPAGSAGRTRARPCHETYAAAALPSERSLPPSTLGTRPSGDRLWLLRGSPEGFSCLFSAGMFTLLQAQGLWKGPLFSKPGGAFCARAFHLGLGSGKGAFCCLCPVFKTQTTQLEIQAPSSLRRTCGIAGVGHVLSLYPLLRCGG